MAYDVALSLVNGGITQFLDLERTVLGALQDGKVTALEAAILSMKGAQLAAYCLMMAQGLDVTTRAEVLQVLHHGTVQWTLPPGGP